MNATHMRARTIDSLIAAQDRATVRSPAKADYVVRMFSRYGEPMGASDESALDAEQAMESTAGEMLAAYGADVFPLILVVGSEAWLASVTVERAGHRVECSIDYREIAFCAACEEPGHTHLSCPTVVEVHPDGQESDEEEWERLGMSSARGSL